MSEGLVDPEMIPRIDTGCVTDAAEDLRAMGGSVAENTDAMVAAWAGLRAEGVYVAPEAETVYGLLDPAVAAAGEVESALGGAADALDVFAEELEEIKPGLEELRAEAAAFRARALSGVDEPASKSPVFVPSYGAGSFRSGEGAEDKQWWESGRLCEENSKLLARINDQVIRIVNAENACVNALHDLIPECFVQQPTDLTGDVLDQLGDLPWGGPSEYQSKNCVESAVLGLCDAIVDMVAGAGSLVAGYDPRTGEFGNWDVTGQTWAGLGNLGLSLLAMVPAPVPAASVAECARGTGADNQATRFIREKEHDLWNTVAGMVNIDPAADDPFAAWKKDGVRSAVSAGVNIGTFFVPGAEVGGAMKGAGLAGKAGRMALRGLGGLRRHGHPWWFLRGEGRRGRPQGRRCGRPRRRGRRPGLTGRQGHRERRTAQPQPPRPGPGRWPPSQGRPGPGPERRQRRQGPAAGRCRGRPDPARTRRAPGPRRYAGHARLGTSRRT
ncbi:hypothetical protein [Propionibacterium australiense]|uniref:Uncharacterized protein n=1 Tax=Propionibacterium australiense TaxID=119981 RepID=A0A8B3FJL2_9ACTN|nr:hypothetical protein [Propionibacterium australiense]RLP06214.1 hypothetical protein D7U36_13185 [Propionibacterium australiense]